jgi:hypothetical protein
MKAYGEFFQDSIDMTDGSVTMTEKEYKAIQLDAWKQGMTDAAGLIIRDGNPEVAKEKIISCRDSKV